MISSWLFFVSICVTCSYVRFLCLHSRPRNSRPPLPQLLFPHLLPFHCTEMLYNFLNSPHGGEFPINLTRFCWEFFDDGESIKNRTTVRAKKSLSVVEGRKVFQSRSFSGVQRTMRRLPVHFAWNVEFLLHSAASWEGFSATGTLRV